MISENSGNSKIIGMRIHNDNEVIIVKFKFPIYICIFYKYKVIFLKNKSKKDNVVNNKFIGIKIFNNSALFYGIFKNPINIFKLVDYNIDFIKENKTDYIKYVKIKNKYKDIKVD